MRFLSPIVVLTVVYMSSCQMGVSQSLPANWPVAALTLPVSSSVVANTETRVAGVGNVPACDAFIISFNNPAGFAQVRNHVETCLKVDGFRVYNDTTDPIPLTHYISKDGKIAVKLSHTVSLKANNNGLMQVPIGDFAIQVVEYDKPFMFMVENSQKLK